METEIVAVDIGGTNARFTLATIDAAGTPALGEVVALRTHEHASLQSAWEAFGARIGRPVPRAAAFSVAGPVGEALMKLTNSSWIIRPDQLDAELGLDRHVLLNDFGAIGHSIDHLAPDDLAPLCGPDRPIARDGTISIVGPGTGLGVAQLRREDGRSTVIETEGGHLDFAPLDAVEDQMLGRLRARYRRVSIERIVSGPGLANIHESLAAIEGRAVMPTTDIELWTLALAGTDALATAALDRFCLILGAAAGDLALAHGAWGGVVVTGGIGARIAERLPQSGFGERFVAKGRFESRMGQIPVKLLVHPQPGLLGAAAAFAARFGG